jgi:ribosomal protein L37AE/L43A
MRANSCPCCGSDLLRHARRQGIYWFCSSCHQEMTPIAMGQLSACIESRKTAKLSLQSVKS